MAPIREQINGVCASSKSGTQGVEWGRRGPIVRSQAKEGRGSPEDENHRHAPCLEIVANAKYKKRGRMLPPICLCEHETSVEFVLIEHGGRSRLSDELMNEPFEVPLNYTFALDCMSLENSVQAGLRGGSLIPTVEDFHPIIAHAGNVVVVKINKGNVANVDHLGVAALPVAGITDGVVHLLFDLTHERCPVICVQYGREWGAFQPLVCHLFNWHTESARC